MTRDRDTLVAAFDVADQLAEFRFGLGEGQRLHGAFGVVIFLTNNTMPAVACRVSRKRIRVFDPCWARVPGAEKR